MDMSINFGGGTAPQQLGRLAGAVPQAVNLVWRGFIIAIRPALARLYVDTMSADLLVTESISRTTKDSLTGLNLSALGMAMVFGGAQATARAATAAALIIFVDRLLKDVRPMTDPAPFDFGPTFGSVRLTRLVRAAGNHVRHGRDWPAVPDRDDVRDNMKTLQDAGIADPQADDVPLQVVKMLGATYFAFEDSLRSTLEDMTNSLAPTGADTDPIAAILGKKIEISVKDVTTDKGFTIKLEPSTAATGGVTVTGVTATDDAGKKV